MKYNEEALNISAQFYQGIQEVDANDEIEQMQNELLPILLKKCAKTLEEDKTQNKGIVKVLFKTKFWVDYDRGTRLLVNLIDANQFDAFASQYCIYLGKDRRECTEYSNGYIEVVWDYKTYFEVLSMSQAIANEGDETPSGSLFEGTLKEARQLEIRKQLEDLEAFASKVAEFRNAKSQNDVVNLSLNGDKNI